MNLLFAISLSKQEWETISLAIAPDKRIRATSDLRFFLNCEEVIDALFKAGAYALASKLQRQAAEVIASKTG
jgi:hypothetical protein